MIPKIIRRWWAKVSQPGTGGLEQPGDWCVIYLDGKKTRFMSYGDASGLHQIFGGKIVWREDD